MLKYRMLLIAGAAFAGIGMIWLVISILSYGTPPQPTLIPLEQNESGTNRANLTAKDDLANPELPTLSPADVVEEKKEK